MKEEIVRIQRDALARIAQASDRRGVEDARVAILGKKGELTLAQTGMKDVPREEKPAVGQLLNEARKAITEALDAKLEEVQAQADKAAVAGVDLTLPARSLPSGGLHPLTIVRMKPSAFCATWALPWRTARRLRTSSTALTR